MKGDRTMLTLLLALINSKYKSGYELLFTVTFFLDVMIIVAGFYI